MRTLLVTGPKGGTGKTSATVNLAALAANLGQKVLVVDADPGCCIAYYLQQDPTSSGELEPLTDTGTFWPKILNRCDLITPYACGSSSQHQLERFLRELPPWVEEEEYDLVILDAPPMLGARARALFRFAEEVLLVLRAEPLSFQLLPAYLNLAKKEAPPGRVTRFLGILMTLGMAQKPTDDGVQAIRERFKGILPITIPHDPETDDAVIHGKPLVLLNPYAPASKSYKELFILLGLLPPEQAAKLMDTRAAESGRPTVP